MAGGSTNTTPTSAILQNFQNPQGPGSAQAFSAGSQPTAQSVSQLQQVLQKLGAQGQGGAQSPAMQLGNLGQGMMHQGQQPMPMMQPMPRPAGSPQPMQGPQVPQMTGTQGMPQQNQMLPWQAMLGTFR